ncbi:hypothetical protein VNO77_15261 [Canavalia gladiata]|uniref:Uncharacterized protein n=1 Tax=Canavalia gladiata TaxID=3824 RepID=A0AAN9QR50_CANGL
MSVLQGVNSGETPPSSFTSTPYSHDRLKWQQYALLTKNPCILEKGYPPSRPYVMDESMKYWKCEHDVQNRELTNFGVMPMLIMENRGYVKSNFLNIKGIPTSVGRGFICMIKRLSSREHGVMGLLGETCNRGVAD